MGIMENTREGIEIIKDKTRNKDKDRERKK